ncbi:MULTISPECIES: hypothetical protein [Kitasatospora]|uniref:DUF397 domain-containing protein n=1 Tax=Kitasatospora cathayae TaxID=3004092 RepID=A0ABY7PWR3_9ACTN|nr:hypothetical protein [Kitasatospora sp. HUAS 3-15]WBP84859.1 hypothetical protein O1G21_02670 [Kitasatospora sp. HUAS 3-15]
METSTATLLYAAELVEENGTYTLVVQDVRRDTVQTTPVPKAMVDKLPTFLSALAAKLNPTPPRGRW